MRIRDRLLGALATGLAFASLSPLAFAVDGVLEINQACAVNTGCFSGDTAGFPVTIDGSAGRSYRLTGDLGSTTLPGGAQDAHFIEVSADNVTVDLNGFRIVCANLLGGRCTGSGSGVSKSSETPPIGITVKNGSIRGMGASGVDLGERAEVTNLRAQSNGAQGILVGAGSTVSGCIVSENTGLGIFATEGSTISGNTASQNGADGITATLGATILGNTTRDNMLDGIVAGSGCTVSGNTASDNGSDGIFASTGSTVSGNTVRLNTEFGLRFLDATAAYSTNTITGNLVGGVSGGVNRGANFCDGPGVVSANCP